MSCGRSLLRDRNLHIVFGVTLMAVLGASSVTPAFPRIVEELGVSPGEVGLLITVFTLPGVFLTPVLGILSDRIGRKRVLVPSLLLFGVAGGACALARDFELLLALRLLQGVGAASLGAMNVTLIGDLFSGRERVVAMGYNSGVLSVGTAGYPVLGGALATLGWFYPFALPLFAVPIGLLVLFSLRSPEPRSEQGLGDYLRAVWKRVRDRRVIGLFTASIVTFIILYGPYLTYLPLLMAGSFGAPPFIIGAVISSSSVVTALTSSQLGWLTRTLRPASLIKASFALYALVLIMVPNIPALPLLLVATALYGIAQGINIPNIMVLLSGVAPAENRGAFMALNGMVLRFGQTVGPVFMGAAAAGLGLAGAFYAAAGLALIMLVLAFLFIR
ncbi:MFS transporter [Rubrobacter taiwanensis]|jgi:ACDE family multidrug resistance protein|uniref:MFS transporter n=1 Tax=Rubrobacter taiwanensis TaxID=185139 RepID=A0A4R1BEJ8_9ACTN|nr:MFS transporter [Rubrobacter taiwanensis]TCJ15585.1 MFS transporter [Rubrobacter taiwanensis]